MTFAEHLIDIGACPEARDWAAGKTSTQAWEECPRADWLIWWAWRDQEAGANTLVDLMAATIAGPRMALRFVPEGENRPLAAIEAAERWAANPTEDNKKAARAAAWAARAAAWVAWTAAWAATEAARAAAWAATEAATEAAARAAAWAAAGAATEAAAWAATEAVEESHKALGAKIREILSQPWKEDQSIS